MASNSRKARNTSRRLGEDCTSPPTLSTATANTAGGRRSQPKLPQTHRRIRLRAGPDDPPPASGLNKLYRFTKAAGINNILTGMIQRLGPKTKVWLLETLNLCMVQKASPPVLRKAKRVAVPKAGKDQSS